MSALFPVPLRAAATRPMKKGAEEPGRRVLFWEIEPGELPAIVRAIPLLV